MKIGPDHLDGWQWVENVLTIANVEVVHERRGTFTLLLAKVDRHLKCHVLIENVLNAGFADALDHLGFVRLYDPADTAKLVPSFMKWRAGVM